MTVAGLEWAIAHGAQASWHIAAQFDALVSLAYNAGARGSRGTWKLIEKGDMAGAAANIKKMTKTTINGKLVVARGLISRRAEEAAPFMVQPDRK